MKHEESRFLLLITIILVFNGCNSEKRIYYRVGRNHLYLQHKNKALFWFNGVHGVDPDNPMFKDIAKAFIDFKPDYVLYEGNATAPDDSLQSILKGENVYVSYLANQFGIPSQSSEPDDSCIFQYLQDSFHNDEIFAMYFIRQMVQWQREGVRVFDSTATVFISGSAPVWLETKGQPNMKQISDKIKPYTGISLLTNNNWKDFDAKKYLYFSDSRINDVYNAVSDYRNIFLLQLIEKQLKLHDRIFIMIGFDHAKEIERELTGLLRPELKTNK